MVDEMTYLQFPMIFWVYTYIFTIPDDFPGISLTTFSSKHVQHEIRFNLYCWLFFYMNYARTVWNRFMCETNTFLACSFFFLLGCLTTIQLIESCRTRNDAWEPISYWLKNLHWLTLQDTL
jgi:hypothetical protein